MCESGTECHISSALTPAVAGLTIMEKPSSHYKLLWQDCSTCVQHTKKSRDWLRQISITLHVSCSVFLEDSLTNGLYAEFWWTAVRLFGVSICCSECINGKWLCETRRKGLWTQFILIVSSQSFSAESKALASAGNFLEQRARSTWLQNKEICKSSNLLRWTADQLYLFEESRGSSPLPENKQEDWGRWINWKPHVSQANHLCQD